MFFRQLVHDDLGCASYFIAGDGVAAVVDPKWEIDDYLMLADTRGFQIRHVLETHNHADHVSGRGRLVAATAATAHISSRADVDYPHEPLQDGLAVDVGGARIVAFAAPGHRPEQLAFVVYDRARASDDPWLLLSGDSLFVGDLARPDLAVEKTEGARDMFRSLQRLLALPDSVELWPGHLGGSLCGGADMSDTPCSTLGFERRNNPLLRISDEQEFVRELTAELAPQPPNFESIVELNRGPLLTQSAELEPLAPARARELLARQAILLDGRETREYDAIHVPGSINVTMRTSGVGSRAAWVLDPDQPVVVSAPSLDEVRRMGRMLEAAGFRKLLGYLAGGMPAWQEAGHQVQSTPAIDVETLAEQLKQGQTELLDVRETHEWQTAHVPGSLHVPYHRLRDGIPAGILNRHGKPLAVACSAGIRSALASSLLRRAGIGDLQHVTPGGVTELEQHGVELVKDER